MVLSRVRWVNFDQVRSREVSQVERVQVKSDWTRCDQMRSDEVSGLWKRLNKRLNEVE